MSRYSGLDELVRVRTAYREREVIVPTSRYSLARIENICAVQERQFETLRLLRECQCFPLHPKRILDVGCGTGRSIREFVSWGASPENITGVDLLASRLGKARRLSPPSISLLCTSAHELPFPDGVFDIVIQSTMFTSILDIRMRRAIADEMLRVLTPGGYVLWYDFHMRNPANADVCPVRKAELKQLFRGCNMKIRRLTLAPPIARWVAPKSACLYWLLAGFHILCSHYLVAIGKPRT